MSGTPDIRSARLIVGLEVHVELATHAKMFSWAASPAGPRFAGTAAEAVEPNELLDPVVVGLPGALPTINRHAVELAMAVGMALNCGIAHRTRFDRKSYFYPDMPKAYQISQYDRPLCEGGWVSLNDLGVADAREPDRRIGIIRAHLEEDAGKLLHEAPGGGAIDFSIVDLNRAGTPLLEIVTAPDFRSAEEVVAFCRWLRGLCVFLGASAGVLQKGHVRFEPNINCELTLAGGPDEGRRVFTPIVEIKNLNSFKAVAGAIAFEHGDQPRRWLEDRREMGRGAKSTRGWDDARGITFLQREKEDAHDYRYFPDPDLPTLRIDDAWRDRVRAGLPELPAARAARYAGAWGVPAADAAALASERELVAFLEGAVSEAMGAGVPGAAAARLVANLILQSGGKRANESVAVDEGRTGGPPHQSKPPSLWELGISSPQLGQIAAMRHEGAINAGSADELFGLLCEPGHAGTDARALAQARGMLLVRDAGAMDAWIAQAIAENAKAADDVRAGKDQAIGRLVGAAMKLAAGRADAAAIRAELLKRLGRA